MSQYTNAMTRPTESSTSLFERIRRDDRAAWRRFVSVYCPSIYDICRWSGVQPCDADDVVQETMQAVFRSIHQFRKEGEEGSFRGWLFRIAQNKIRDHFRRSAKQPAGAINLEQVAEALSEESRSNLANSDTALLQALTLIREEFEEKTWTAFWRMVVDQDDADRIAGDLGMTRNCVRQAKFRVLKRLRAEFGDVIDLGK